jgi:pyruvate/2-oxoglutarate/acetoin dehydrogenase E1 component
MEHRSLLQTRGPVPEGEHLVPFGRAAIARAGSDVTVVGITVMVQRAMAAADALAREGVSVEVIDPRTLQPLDERALIDSVKKTNRCVVAHEAVTRMGFGAEVASVVQYGAFDWLDAPIERVGAKFTPLPFAPVMEEFVVPHARDVLEAIRRTVARSNGD